MTELKLSENFYPQKYPQVGDLVMARITQINDSVYCQLLEYNIEALLPLSEISTKKVRNVKHALRIGAQEVMEVITVDTDKGYVDTSRKKITPEQSELFTFRYQLAKRMHSFFNRWSHKIDQNLIETVLWPNYDADTDADADGYYSLITDTNWIDAVKNDHQEALLEDFQKQFEKKAQKYAINFEMVCYSLEGVRALNEAIDKGLEMSTSEIPLQCNYTGKTGGVGNIFQLSTTTKDTKDNAVSKLQATLAVMETSIGKYRSKFVILD